MTKFLMLPPVNDDMRSWAHRLHSDCPDLNVEVVESEDDLRSAIVDAEAGYGWISPEFLPLASKFRWLQNPYAGPFVGYYYQELINHPLTITNPRGIYSDHIAHHILMFMLALSRGLPYWMSAQAERRWDKAARKRGYVDIAESVVLIVGVGGIGAETAKLCMSLGADVIGIDPRPEHQCDCDIFPPSELDNHLPSADFVITTVPHTPETEFMWNARRFSLMKTSAYFINIGRGKTTRLADLTQALQDDEIAGTGLDVYETEPLPEDHPLWTMENVILTPHVAVANAENITERRYQLLLENCRRFVKGDTLLNVVDKSRWY